MWSENQQEINKTIWHKSIKISAHLFVYVCKFMCRASQRWQLPKCVVPIGSVLRKWQFAASSDESGCKARSHNLIVPSAEHVAKETPPEQPLATHARDGSCMFSQQRFLISHMHAECETSTQQRVA